MKLHPILCGFYGKILEGNTEGMMREIAYDILLDILNFFVHL
jgi:hypothetical protein